MPVLRNFLRSRSSVGGLSKKSVSSSVGSRSEVERREITVWEHYDSFYEHEVRVCVVPLYTIESYEEKSASTSEPVLVVVLWTMQLHL